MSESRTLSQIIIEAMRRCDFNVEKLARATGISERFLELLIGEKFNQLPPAPYVRGYLREIGKLLNLNGDELWNVYLRNREDIKRSGRRDELPVNRFALSPLFNRSVFMLGLVVIVVFSYLIVRGGAVIGQPSLSIIRPADSLLTVSEADFLVQGQLSPLTTLTLNGTKVYPDREGNFEISVQLQPGLNNLEFRTKRFLGKERIFIRQVFYQPLSLTND